MYEQLPFSQDYIYKIKIMIMGMIKSGKSTLIHTFCQGKGPQHTQENNEIDIRFKRMYYKSKKGILGTLIPQNNHYECKLQLFDIPAIGLKQQYDKKIFDNVHVFIVMMDLLDKNSFSFTKQIIEKMMSQYSNESHIYIVGNVAQSLAQFQTSLNSDKPKYKENRLAQRFSLDSNALNEYHSQLELNNLTLATNRQSLMKYMKYIDKGNMQYHELCAQNQIQVFQLFQSITSKVMKQVQQGIIPVDKVVYKNKEKKVILKIKEQSVSHFPFEKRYNRCC